MKLKRLTFTLTSLSLALFIIVNLQLFVSLGPHYEVLFGQSLIVSCFVFFWGSIVYSRSKLVSLNSSFFILLTFSLGWIIQFYISVPMEIYTSLIVNCFSFLFPIFLFSYYLTIGDRKISIASWLIPITIILITYLFTMKKFTWEIELLVVLILCILDFSFNGNHSYHQDRNTRSNILRITLLTLACYLISQNIHFIFKNITFNYTDFLLRTNFPNIFLLFFLLYLGYKIIKSNDLFFETSSKDFLVATFIVLVVLILVLFTFHQIIDLSYSLITLVTFLIYSINFLGTNLFQLIFLYRYSQVEENENYSQLEKNIYEKNISVNTVLDSLYYLILIYIKQKTNPKGVIIILLNNDKKEIVVREGSLQNFNLSKKYQKVFNLLNPKIQTIHNTSITCYPLMTEEKVNGWILLDKIQKDKLLSSDYSNISTVLEINNILNQENNLSVPGYFTSHKKFLKEYSFSKRDEQLRKELSYYLHDNVLQNILAIKNICEILNNKMKYKDENLTVVISELNSLNNSIREKMFDIYPSNLIDLNFSQSISLLIDNLLATLNFKGNSPSTSVNIDYNIHINKDLRFPIYRMIRELVTNSLKHSKAEHIVVEINEDFDNLYIIVNDDGIGFNSDGVSQSKSSHYGLVSIFQEVENLSGKIQIKQNKPKGTRVEILIYTTREDDLNEDYSF